jgi:hypothetical protein
MEKERVGKGYTIDDLVKIGDQLHDSSSAIVLTLVKHNDGTCTSLGSATGTNKDLTMLIIQVLENSPELESLFYEALVLKKMQTFSKLIDQFKNNTNTDTNEN